MARFLVPLALLVSSTAQAQRPISDYTAQPVTDLFDIDLPSCNKYLDTSSNPVSTLQRFANEAFQLAFSGLSMLQTGVSQPNNQLYYTANQYLEVFFKNGHGSYPNIQRLTTVFQSLFNFWESGTQPAGNQYQARLFCDDSSFELVEPDDVAYQLNGEVATDEEGDVYSIRELYEDYYNAAVAEAEEKGEDEEAAIFLVRGSPSEKAPGFVIYLFTAMNILDDDQLCGEGARGYTWVTQSVNGNPSNIPIILLCPVSFTLGGQVALGDAAPEPIDPSTQLVPGEPFQPLDDLEPYSTTFIHETIHFIPWSPTAQQIFLKDVEETLADGREGDGYNLADVIQYDADDATQNVESYVYFSLGSWYTYNRLVQQTLQNGLTITRGISYALAGICVYI